MTRIFGTADAAAWAKGRLYGPDLPLCRTWRHDSREVEPGDAFVALSGENTDGHLYVMNAIERGAQVVLVDEARYEQLGLSTQAFAGLSVITAANAETALAQIAQEYLRQTAPKVVGITGSVGKTTTRELTVAVLKEKYRVHSAVRSFNTILGCSLTILAMPTESEILILELGTNHFGEISKMVELFPPDFCVITEIAPAHLEGFGTIEGVLRAKMEICESKKAKILAYNSDNEALKKEVSYKCNNLKMMDLGQNSEAELRIENIETRLTDTGAKIKVTYRWKGKAIDFEAALFGSQHAWTIGYAVAIGKYFGVSDRDMRNAISQLKPLAGRGALKRTGRGAWVIDEAYNANPSSMKAALENVARLTAPQQHKCFAVLGGMRELGKNTKELHEDLLPLLSCFDHVIVYGEEWNGIKLPENVGQCEGIECVIQNALAFDADDNTLILIKGSNSYGLKQIVALLTEVADVHNIR